jgi:hypothetical protein
VFTLKQGERDVKKMGLMPKSTADKKLLFKGKFLCVLAVLLLL